MSYIPHNSGLRAQRVAENAAEFEEPNQPAPANRIILGDTTQAAMEERALAYQCAQRMPPSPASIYRSDDRVDLIDVIDNLTASAPQLPLPANLEGYLNVDVETDNLCALPGTTGVKLKTPEWPAYNGLPVLVQTEAAVFTGQKGKEFYDPEKDRPWVPFRDGASKVVMAHVEHKTAGRKRRRELRQGDGRYGRGENVEAMPREERSWKRAQMSGRLKSAYAKRMREWQRRRAAWEKVRAEDRFGDQESSSESSSTLSVRSEPSMALLDDSSFPDEPSNGTLEPLRRILREENSEYWSRGYAGFKPEWAKRGAPPDEETRATQAKVFDFAKRLWEHVEGRPMESNTPPLEPLWASNRMRRVPGDATWRGGIEDAILGYYSTQPSEDDKKVQKTRWEILMSKFRTHPDDADDQLPQQGEGFDVLQTEYDELDEIFDMPEMPVGVFDEAEVAYYMDRERRELLKELRAEGATSRQLGEFHEKVYGATSEELDEIGREAREVLVESGKILPKLPRRKRVHR